MEGLIYTGMLLKGDKEKRQRTKVKRVGPKAKSKHPNQDYDIGSLTISWINKNITFIHTLISGVQTTPEHKRPNRVSPDIVS